MNNHVRGPLRGGIEAGGTKFLCTVSHGFEHGFLSRARFVAVIDGANADGLHAAARWIPKSSARHVVIVTCQSSHLLSCMEHAFGRFDYVLAMDEVNRRALARLCRAADKDRLRLFLDFAPETGMREVPDPYYGGPDGFEHVLDLVEAASRGLLAHIKHAKGL